MFEPENQLTYINGAWAISPDTMIYPMGANLFRVSWKCDSLHTQLLDVDLKLRGVPVHGALGVSAEHRRMVYAYKYAKVIKFMDLGGRTIRTLNFEQSGFEEGSSHVKNGLDSNPTHYMKVLPTRDYVYLTYSGQVPYDVGKGGKYYMYLEIGTGILCTVIV